MLWLIIFIFHMLLICTWLENENRQANQHINFLVKQAKINESANKFTTRSWLG